LGTFGQALQDQQLLAQRKGLPVAMITQQTKTESRQWGQQYQQEVPEYAEMMTFAEAEVKAATASLHAATSGLLTLRRLVLGPHALFSVLSGQVSLRLTMFDI